MTSRPHTFIACNRIRHCQQNMDHHCGLGHIASRCGHHFRGNLWNAPILPRKKAESCQHVTNWTRKH